MEVFNCKLLTTSKLLKLTD